jgi:hypothetical protein
MDAQLSDPNLHEPPVPGQLIGNGAMVMCVSSTHLLAISPTGAFAIWVFHVSEEVESGVWWVMDGKYFRDLDDAVAAWKKIT